MGYQYTAFGIPIESSFELAGLNSGEETINSPHGKIIVRRKAVPEQLNEKPLETSAYGQSNENETILLLPGIAKFYIYNGRGIDVEPLCDNADIINQQLYANCLSMALLQRDILLFHCSGIFINNDEVILFAAPKQTGKSTLSVLLHQKGYLPFTDDTALITFNGDACFAQASYPMLRLTENSILQQKIYVADSKQTEKANIDKTAFYFHSAFISKKAKIKGIAFLEHDGNRMFTTSLRPSETIGLIVDNIYRRKWLWNMKKQRLEFDFLSNIAGKVPMWKAVRPLDLPTYTEFTDMIEKNIIDKVLQV